MQDLQTEYGRVLANPDASTANGFGRRMRIPGLRSDYQNGDIIEFPVLHYDRKVIDGTEVNVLVNASGNKVIIHEPMFRNGDPAKRENGDIIYLDYIILPVYRPDAEGNYPTEPNASCRFFASAFWKRRRIVKNIGTEDAPIWEQTEDSMQSDGDVITFAREFASVDDAMIGISTHTPNKVKVTEHKFKTFAYGTTDVEDDHVFTFNFA